MGEVLVGTELQRQTLRLYGELVCRRESWAGKLVFAAGEGASGSGLAAAVSIAGGTALVVDPDGAAVKRAFRNGGVDFVVNSLDEALRILKNEIRKGTPVGVAVVGEVGAVVEEMRERGVVADLYVAIKTRELLDQGFEDRQIGDLEFSGMKRLQLGCADGIVASTEDFRIWLAERGWVEASLRASTNLDMRIHDIRLLEILPLEDSLRRNWVERISRYQRVIGDGARVVWLTESERDGCRSV